MKKIMRFFAALGAVSLVLGFFAGVVEKKRERTFPKIEKDRGRHSFYGSYEAHFKRPLDFALSFFAIIFLSPVIVILAILVKVKLGKPVLFQQERPGKDGKIFRLYKFRTMTDARDKEGNLLPDEERLPEFGKRLRSTSLDELPELFNILKGDMSIVGPRPQLVRDMVFMTAEQRKRHDVKQGLTGLAQVNGRNEISWEEKLAFDTKYVEKITLWGDTAIVLQTIKNVFRREGIHSEGMATAEDYGDYLLRKGCIDEKRYAEGQIEAQRIIEREKGR